MSAGGEFTVIDGVPKPMLARALRAIVLELLQEKRRKFAVAAKSLGAYIESPNGFPSKLPDSARLEELVDALGRARGDYYDAVLQAERIAMQAHELDGDDEAPGDEEHRT